MTKLYWIIDSETLIILITLSLKTTAVDVYRFLANKLSVIFHNEIDKKRSVYVAKNKFNSKCTCSGIKILYILKFCKGFSIFKLCVEIEHYNLAMKGK